MTDNRSISIGGNVSGSVLQTGDHNVTTLTTTTLPPASEVDIVAVIAELRAVLTASPASDPRGRIAFELDDAASEAKAPAPDKAQIAGALERAVGAFKKTADFVGSAEKVTELVTKAAGWIGSSHLGGLLTTVGLTL